MNRMYASLLGISLVCSACGSEADDEASGRASLASTAAGFGVGFQGCTEFAGIGFVPHDNARALVPASYTLAGDADTAIAVVRVANCAAVSVDGKSGVPGTIAQVGVTLAAGDPSADINNYTLWLATDLGVLHGKLKSVGVDNENDQSLSYVFDADGMGGGSLSIAVAPPKGAGYTVTGDVLIPSASPVPFVATWWADTKLGQVSMRTEFPAIVFSDVSLSISTPPGSALAELSGSTSMSFSILNSYNAFDTAMLALTVSTN